MWPLFGPLWRTLAGRTAPAHANALTPGATTGATLGSVGLSREETAALLRSGSLAPHFTYRRYRKPKPAGGWREIAEPDPRLKYLQKCIARQLLTAEPAHPAALAYRSGTCTGHHARAHAGAQVIVTADVTDFFPSTGAPRIEAWWRARHNTDAAHVLALLTTDRGALPQGAPTSPALSNLVNVKLDAKLTALAAVAGATYTRYCDDLAFSWPRGDGPPSEFERGVRSALHAFGYLLHPSKGWTVYDLRDEPELTGVVLARNGGVRLPDRVREVMRALARSADPAAAGRLEGYRGYEAMVLGRKRKTRGLPRGGPF